MPATDKPFHLRVAVLNRSGCAIYYAHRELARELVRLGVATIEERPGKIRQIRLTKPADSFAERIGEPSGPSFGVRFTRWERLDGCAGRIIQHHPRCYAEVRKCNAPL